MAENLTEKQRWKPEEATEVLESPAEESVLPEVPEGFRSGFVGILGRPNAGKSTLLNALVGQKLAAVTEKPQTTRTRISGIRTTERAQLVFLDTPGIIEPRYRLQEHMVEAALQVARDADLLLYVIDVTRAPHPADDAILERLPRRAPMLLVLNKIDRIKKPMLLPLLDEYGRRNLFAELIPISAKNYDGVDRLLEVMEEYLPPGPLLFPPDQVSDLPQRFFVAETVREKIFQLTRQEVPYASSVVVEEFVEEPGASRLYIRVAIYVEKPSQKAILIGKQGRMLREIGRAARQEIEQFLQAPVFLELYVGVRKGWRQDDRNLREFGYAP
ncbi:MAG: GTPase Era [Candidatus Poribacteria bacterium]|nr:MAG: GTPase Era [Candidatus Poribacteria bacterium]